MDFRRRNDIVHMLQAPITEDEEIILFNRVYNALSGKKYDKPAILYWLWAGLLKKFFGVELPKKNPMDHEQFLYCVEVIEVLAEYLDDIGADYPADAGMLSPEMLYNEMIENNVLRVIC